MPRTVWLVRRLRSTTFLVGLAAGRDGADPASVRVAAQIVTQLLTEPSSRET